MFILGISHSPWYCFHYDARNTYKNTVVEVCSPVCYESSQSMTCCKEKAIDLTGHALRIKVVQLADRLFILNNFSGFDLGGSQDPQHPSGYARVFSNVVYS